MLLVFKTKTAPNVLMFANHVLPILRAGGRDLPEGMPERGVITPEQLPQMIKGIEAAIAGSEPEVQTHEDEEHEQQQHPMNRPVSLRQRAYPLLEMLRLADKAEDNVMWETADTSW